MAVSRQYATYIISDTNQFFIMNQGMKSAKIQLSAQAKEASIHRELAQRKYGSWYLAAINFSMTILFVVLHYTTVILHDQTVPYFSPFSYL